MLNRTLMITGIRFLAMAVFCLTIPAKILSAAEVSDTSNSVTQAQQILEATDVKGGLIVHLGCGDGLLTAALRANKSYIVHGLDTDPISVQKARRNIQSQGVYGNVSVSRLNEKQLPYITNLVNLVVSEDMGDVSMNEVMRVLCPNGVAYIKTGETWTKTVKPRPDNIDEWTHFMHDATGNAVAHDEVVGPPRHLQWVGSPRWSRHHDRMASMSALVSTGGRIFYIMDEGSRISIQLPSRWSLIARDAFNGTILWKRPIPTWQNHLWPLKSGPTQLARRLVATGERVYVTLGFNAPLTELDAATGKILRTYEGSEGTEEVLASDGVLVLLVNEAQSDLTKYAPLHNVGDQRRVANEWFWNEKPRQIMAFQADTGRVLWKKSTRAAPLTLAADHQRVFYHDGEKVMCLDRTNGEELWSSKATRRPSINFNFGPKLVIYRDVLLFAGGDRSMRALSIDSGKQLWSAPHAQSGYQSPEDLLVARGLVWSAPTTRTGDSGIYTGRDPHTGEVKVEFPPNVTTYWFHHRCYIAKATDRFLLPSRTGIEFVDHQKESWDIHHWVRGGCLYGIMPCNGLTYAPPHNCACYPEAKIYGMNALAPASADMNIPRDTPDAGRLEKGPAYNEPITASVTPAAEADWPTYRRDSSRSGYTKHAVSTKLKRAWQTQLGDRLSSVVVADGTLYVAKVDSHSLYALDINTGLTLWSYTTEGRIDSPPTIYQGKALFGSADGYVYCLRATDGALIWRFRAAPIDRRLPAYEQLESVWPVHGSVLIQDDYAYFVAGRSNFLDGGLRWFKLDPNTGRKLVEVSIDDRDPETGGDIQDRIQVLNMPVGLPDILSSDGRYVYMRSQLFDFEGNRQDIGPHSGQPAEQGSVQSGDGMHLFSPTGYLDGTWFHRSYWVYGRSFAGGHAGYYQAGKFAPAGRLLVFDDTSVYGFSRKPEYYKWTTILEHQLFAADKQPPSVPKQTGRGGSMVQVPKSKSLNPTGVPLAVEAWVKAEQQEGVVLARGGPAEGYALVVRKGRPRFVVRAGGTVSSVSAKQKIVGRWVHLAGVLTSEKKLLLYVNGKQVATAKASGLIQSDPAQAMEIGADDGGAVGSYNSPLAFTGLIDEVKVYHGNLTGDEVKDHFENPAAKPALNAKLVFSASFDKGDGTDDSGNNNHGKLTGAQAAPGKVNGAMRFAGRPNNRGSGSFVKHDWNQGVPLLVRAMVLTDKTLFIAGPPDLINEEETFQRLTERDPRVKELLAKQDAALQGSQGALLQAVNVSDGSKLAEYQLPSLPVWDGMIAAGGRLYLTTEDGAVLCFTPE